MNQVTAKDVLNEFVATSEFEDIRSLDDLISGDVVMYKEGTKHAGMVGRVVNMHQELNTVDLKVGNATRVDVPLSDLAKEIRSA